MKLEDMTLEQLFQEFDRKYEEYISRNPDQATDTNDTKVETAKQ